MIRYTKNYFLLVATFFLLPLLYSFDSGPYVIDPSRPCLEVYVNKTEALVSGKILLNTSGKVYSINKGKKTSTTSNSKRVKVTVTKTGGKAKTEISILTLEEASFPFSVPIKTLKKRYTFESGNYSRTKTFTLFKAKGKEIEVWLDNKSFSNTFDYSLKVEEI